MSLNNASSWLSATENSILSRDTKPRDAEAWPYTYWKIFLYKWTSAIQTHVVQESAVQRRTGQYHQGGMKYGQQW